MLFSQVFYIKYKILWVVVGCALLSPSTTKVVPLYPKGRLFSIITLSVTICHVERNHLPCQRVSCHVERSRNISLAFSSGRRWRAIRHDGWGVLDPSTLLRMTLPITPILLYCHVEHFPLSCWALAETSHLPSPVGEGGAPLSATDEVF